MSEIFYLPFKPRKTRYVIGWHTLLKKTKAWLVRKILFGRSKAVIAVSDCAAGTVKKYFPGKKVVTILNGVDTEFFNPGKFDREYVGKKFGVDFSKPVVLFVGALFERKRPDVFIEIARRYDNANFVLVGRKDKTDFITPTKGLNRFKWIPFMEREDVAVMMASSDVFLFPSVYEPCAAVIPEAMASGLPVILSRSCGNHELITHEKEGFLIDPGKNEADEFVKYLDALLANSAYMKTIGENARRKCEEELNWSTVSKRYEEVFSTLP